MATGVSCLTFLYHLLVDDSLYILLFVSLSPFYQVRTEEKEQSSSRQFTIRQHCEWNVCVSIDDMYIPCPPSAG